MFVLFLCLGFSSVSVKCETKPDNATEVKTQLQKSLFKVNELLADIEGKIKKERKLLSQIDFDLNYNEPQGFMDYQVTDIWWHSSSSTVSPTLPPTVKQKTTLSAIKPEGAKEQNVLHKQILLNQQINQTDNNKNNSSQRDVPKLEITDIVSNWVRIMATTLGSKNPISKIVETSVTLTSTYVTTTTSSKATETTLAEQNTTLTIFPQPRQQSLPPGVPPGWPFGPPTEGTTPTPFVQELRNTMKQDQLGYFTTFLAKYCELIHDKDPENSGLILEASETVITRMLEGDKTDALGDTIENTIPMLFVKMKALSLDQVRNLAEVGNTVIKKKKVFASTEINRALDYYDSILTREEGEKLFESTEHFNNFPEGGKTALEVCQGMLDAAVDPFVRISGTRQQRVLVSYIHEAIQELNPHWRVKDEESTFNVNRGISNTSTDKNSTIPSRRGMGHNYKKVMRHFILKHPTLFKSFNRHYKHSRKYNHHHQNHRKHHRLTHKIHKKHGHAKHGYEQIMRKHIYRKNNEKHIDSSASEAYYREPPSKIKRTHKIKHKKRILHTTRPSTFPNNIKAEYFKHLKQKLLAKKRSKNFRRFIIESLEKEIDTKSKNVDKKKLHKIKEVSSYSDEEDYLRSNLYDALRHGNRTFIQFRAFDSDKQTIRDSSSDLDDEWIIKNNIYKVFGRNITF